MYSMMWWHSIILTLVENVRDGVLKVMKAGTTLDDMM
jgi:hypothetical protein